MCTSCYYIFFGGHAVNVHKTKCAVYFLDLEINLIDIYTFLIKSIYYSRPSWFSF